MDYDVLIPAEQQAARADHRRRTGQRIDSHRATGDESGSMRDLVSNVFNYPTLAECYKLAALDCLHRLEQRKDA